jgi:hypothetical protein
MQLLVVLLVWGLFMCVPCVVCMFPPVLMMLARPWLVRQFVYNTLGQIGSSFVRLLFPICVLFLSVYSSQFPCCFLNIFFIMFMIPIFCMLVYMFTMSKECSQIIKYSQKYCHIKGVSVTNNCRF